MCDFFFIPIFCGSWDQVKNLGPESFPCPRCHNTAVRSIKRRRWFTLYCVPLFPVTSNRDLVHCDICRWEGVRVANVQVRDEGHGRQRRNRRHRHRHRQREANSSSSSNSDDDGKQSAPPIEQPPPPSQSNIQNVNYAQTDYEAPPPPYSKE